MIGTQTIFVHNILCLLKWFLMHVWWTTGTRTNFFQPCWEFFDVFFQDKENAKSVKVLGLAN